MPLFGIVALSEREDNLTYYRVCGMLSDSQLGTFHLMKTLMFNIVYVIQVFWPSLELRWVRWLEDMYARG